MDAKKSGMLNRDEFATFMNALELNYSRKKMVQVFREIDRDFDDQVSYEELFLFIFPDPNVAKALVKKKAKMLGQRIKIKARDRANTLSQFKLLRSKPIPFQHRPPAKGK